jgi:hypothetical protein
LAQDAKYKPYPYIFQSRGIYARFATDRPPGEGFYLNLTGAEEREEQVLSSRYGSVIINRDPQGIGVNNYFFASAPSTIARLVSGASSWRYVGLANGTLLRRAGLLQGNFTQISAALSGKQFSSLVTPCFQSAQPYLFIADASIMLKDSGAGNPVSWGIGPPSQAANTLQYAPSTSLIEGFTSGAGFTTAGFTITGVFTIGVVNGTGATSILSGNYEQYACGDFSAGLVQDGSIGTDGVHGLGLKFNTLQNTSFFDIVNFSGAYTTPNASFTFTDLQGTVAANSTGTIGKTSNFDFSAMTPDDLFVLVVSISAPNAVSEVRLQFDVNSSGYTSSYYYKSISPASFQSGVTAPQVTSPSQSLSSAVSALAQGIIDSSVIGKLSPIPTSQLGNPDVPILQPRPLTTGSSSWSVVYIRKGDFVPVGNAGAPGLDWAKITGWQIQFITGNGSITAGLNALYTQKGSGPSSYGGVGYDYRYTYFDAVTQTESNPTALQVFPITPTNPAGSSTLIVLRQAINVQGQYSSNPRVTHVRVYRRGGTLPGPGWLLVDQIANITGTGTFNYKDVFTDANISVQPQLNLTNDQPVTSTLQNPIVTTLSGPLAPTAPFIPITVTVANGAAVFVVGQIVNIGTPANFEQVIVAVAGVGSFQACVQLAHATGEAVQVFSTPAQPVNLAALAYNQVWLAGDPNNPHLLYFSNPAFPENFPPQNYIPVSSPADPIQAIINFRGTLFVATKSTWYQVYPGSPPTAQPTGSKHGLAAPFGWTQTESAIWYQAFDGIREFRGADGAYRTALIEWLFQNQPTSPSPSPVVALDQTKISQVQMAYWNNRVFVIYPGVDGSNHELIFNTVYQRWRNNDLYVNTIFYEIDTNILLIGRVSSPGAPQGIFVLAQDQVGDFDDVGWSAGILQQQAIPFNIQTPYYDQSMIDNQKQYNMVEVDANTNNQVLTLTLLFDDNDGTIAPIILPTFTGPKRQKFQFIVNSGFGQQAYRMSVKLTASVLVAPIIYQMEMHAVPLAEQLNSYDIYWIKFGTDESKLVKQGYFDYTSTAPITVSLFADGSLTPYYTFILPTNSARTGVPQRVRFSPMKLRLFRLVATCAGNLQFWAAPQIDQKPVKMGGGYARSELVTA